MTTSDVDRIVLEWVLNAFWQIGMLALVAIAVYPLLRNTSARIRYGYWVAAASLCVAIPVLSLVFLGLPRTAESRALLVQATANPASTALAPLLEPPPIAVPKELPQFAILGYLACLGIALLGISRSIRTIFTLQKEAEAGRSDPRLDEIVLHCASVLEVFGAKAIVSDQVRSPITIGFRKPLILVPSGLVQTADGSTLLAIVGHEMAHIKRKDFLVNLLAQVLVIPVQFHPLIWYLVGRMRRLCELACDELVTGSLMSKRAYARRLLEVAADSIQGGTMRPQLAFGTDSLEERIRTLVAPSKFVHSPRIQRLTMMFACSILLIAGAGTGLVFVRAQDTPAPAGQGQAPRRSDDVTLDISDKRVTPPKVLDQTIPSYTEEARARGVEGIVLLECIIRTTGRATDFRLLRRLGSGLDEAAITEIRDNWKFTPANLKGKPVSVVAKIEVTFTLHRRQDEIPPSEAEGLAIQAVHLIGLSENEAASARALLKMQDSTRFQKTAFDSDVKTLTEKFGLTRESVYKSSSGGVVIKYWFR